MALADCIDELEHQPERLWDVVVIGSGYGAGICAARLAEAGAKVCVLERGREFSVSAGAPFPSTMAEFKENVQIDGAPFRREHRLGLYNFHVASDLDVVVGCGLGGTSLINANVAIKPDERVFQQLVWPKIIREEAATGALDRYYERARRVLDPAAYPANWPTPRKLAAMEANGGTRSLVNVHFGAERKNSVGVPQRACNNCGDCVTGCNFEAKKTLCFTYLPLAKAFGAKIFTQCDAHHVERREGFYVVQYQRLRTGAEPLDARAKVLARAVVVGAGVMGSTAFLLRSRELGLRVSAALGSRMSGNGDAIAFAYDCDSPLDTIGRGAKVRSDRPTGATVLGIIDRRSGGTLEDGFILEEGAFPSVLAPALRVLAQVIAAYSGRETQHGFAHWFRERLSEAQDLVAASDTGALNRTLMLLLTGHDGADGRIELDKHGRAVVRWPELKHRSVIKTENAGARELAARLGGAFVKNPLDTPLLLNNLITVHPLGGCPIGDDSASGVVDAAGRVFSDDGAVHRGLYVVDGSIVPTSLGVNPLWTISALAERAAEHIARDLALEPRAACRIPAGVEIQP